MSENPVTAVTREVKRHVELKEQLDALYDDLDPQALADTLEGETDLSEVLQRLATQALDYEDMAQATQARIDDLQTRKHRLKGTADTLRAIILQAMDTSDMDQVKGPEVTLSRRKTKGQLVIDDESQIPSHFWAAQAPKLDKTGLAASVKEGTTVPGCHLSNGSISLTIRVK